MEDCSKTYHTTYDEIFTVDLLGLFTFRAKIFKKFEPFLISNSLSFAKSLSYRFLFYFAWMLNKTKFLIPEILRWGHRGRLWEKRDNLPVPSLSVGTRSPILAICQHLIVQISHRMVKDLSKQ